MITIQELLFNRGLPQNPRIKLVRHIDSRIDLRSLYINNKPTFLRYQNSIANPRIK